MNIAKTLSDVGDCEISDLLDPKFYFDLRVGLFDEVGNRYPGSGGEAYTALALLCIGRMSVIQRDKNRTGVRFIIIEELSNIDDTNFGLFPEIAKMFGYQLLTMTPKPFGSYSESEWFLHMLIRGKDKNINYQPMSLFRTKTSKQRLEEYMGDGKIEAMTPLTISVSTDENVVVVTKAEKVAQISVPAVEETTTPVAETKTEEMTRDQHDTVMAGVVEGFINVVTTEMEIRADEESPIIANLVKADELSEKSPADEHEETFVSETPMDQEDLTTERKEEFLGLNEEPKEEEKKDNAQNPEEDGNING
jgi:hypothetical protein